jgi:hypothetical protein
MLRKDYIGHIDRLKIESNNIYTQVGGLRDAAPTDEKEYFNRLRTLLREVWSEFEKLENHIHASKTKKQDRIS